MAAGLLLVGQARIHVFIPGASAIRPALVLCVVGLGVWLVQKDWIRSPKRLKSGPVRAGIFVGVWAVIGVPFALWQGGAARFLLESFSSTFLIFLIVAAAVRNLEDVRRMVGVFALGTAVYALLAPQNRISRAFGAGGYDPNDSAMFLVSGVPVLVFFVLFGRRKWIRAAAAICAVYSLYAFVDTQSRGGFIAILAVLLFMVLMLKGVKPALRAGVVALIVLVSIPVTSADYWDRMQTIQELDDGYAGTGTLGGRRNIWGRAIRYTMENPVTGVGINNFTVAESAHPDIRARIQSGRGFSYRAAHSMWFHTLAELGIPGFLGFVAIFGLSFKYLLHVQSRSVRAPPVFKSKELKVMAGVLMASLVGLIAAGSFLSNGYLVMVWGPLGIIAGLVKVVKEPSRGRRHRPSYPVSGFDPGPIR